MTRKEVDELLWNKLPDWMTETQKKNKVGNLIGELRRGDKIANQGSDARPAWALVKKARVKVIYERLYERCFVKL